MDYIFMLGFIAFLIFSYFAKMISEKGLKILEESKKIQLIDAFSKQRMVIYFPLIIIVAVFFGAVKYFSNFLLPVMISYIFITILYLFIIALLSYNKLKKLDFPKEYLKFFVYAQLIRFSGIVLLFGSIIVPIMKTL